MGDKTGHHRWYEEHVLLAKALNINQAAVSKMERRTDMYISTLRDYIRAMGAELEIIATFPDGQVKIDNFAY